MTVQETILHTCTHQTGTSADCQVRLASGEKIRVCCDCWNKSVMARREARKAELAAMPRCEVGTCNRRATYYLGSVELCGRHFKQAKANFDREMYQATGGMWLPIPVHLSQSDILRLATQKGEK